MMKGHYGTKRSENMKIVKKMQKLSAMNTDFLRELASTLLLQYRDYSKYEREDIIKILDKKLTADDIDIVSDLYSLCVPPRKIAEKIKREDMFNVRKAVEMFFSGKDFLHEVLIDSRKCDVVFCDGGSVVAIEIKSGNDKIKRAIEQTNFYKRWANEVYLAFDRSHKNFVLQSDFVSNGVGLLEYSEGKIHQLREASHQKINSYNRLLFITYRDLAKTARNANVNFKGTKKEIAMKVSKKLSPDVIDKLFCDYLRQTYS